MKYLLDGIVWIGILLPLFTGGFWIEKSGNQYGIYSPNIGMGLFLVMAFFLYLGNKKKLLNLSELSSFQFLNRLKNFWLKNLEANSVRTLILASFAFCGFYLLVSIRKHWSFNTHAYDTGIFTNAIWNLVFRGEYVSSLKGGNNLFADHQSPAFWLWAPFFRLVPKVETLLISQSLILALGGIAVFYLGRQSLGEKSLAAAFLPFVYWLNPAVISANNFEFHPEVIVLPSGLWALCAIQSKKKWIQWLSIMPLLLFLGGKESSGPVVAGIGLSFLLGAGGAEPNRRLGPLGICLMVLGVLYFYFCIQWVPKFFGVAYAYTGAYHHLGNSILEIVASPILRPLAFWGTLFEHSRVQFFWYLLFPLAFLPLLSWRYYPSFFVAFLMLFMIGSSSRLYPRFHYGIESSVGLFWALPMGVKLLRERTVFFQKEWRIVVLLFICTILSMRQNQIYHARIMMKSSHLIWVEKELLTRIDPEATLSVPTNLVPRLSNRPWVTPIPELRKKNGELVSCVFVDPSMDISPLNVESISKWRQELIKLGFKERFRCNSLSVYQNPNIQQPCLINEPRCY
jgi:hypothetical protein